jgi:hypothetical protein
MRPDVVTQIGQPRSAEMIDVRLPSRHLVQVADKAVGADRQRSEVGFADEEALSRLEHTPALDGLVILGRGLRARKRRRKTKSHDDERSHSQRVVQRAFRSASLRGYSYGQ